MRRGMLALLAVIVALPGPSSAGGHGGGVAAPQQAAQAKIYEHKLFFIALPKGWKVVREREQATPLGGDYIEHEAGGAARLEDGQGSFFEIIIPCAPTDVAGDAMWHCMQKPARESATTCVEQPPCTKEWQRECLNVAKETGDEDFCLCTAGDGKLDIWATLDKAGERSTCFLFGNSKRETGVDLTAFRDMLKSFQAKARPASQNDDAEAGQEPSE